MQYHEHKKYFEIAYRNGADVWTHLPIKRTELKLTEKLKVDSLILDAGSGRGLIAKQLAESGFRVIGIDFEKNIVEKTNSEIKNWGLEGKLKFLEADVLDIPFTDNSFDGVCDFGLLENLFSEDWVQYANEINRVLKPGGYYLNLSISKETQHFFEFYPKGSETGDFQKYGVHYHFFEAEEMSKIFEGKFKTIYQENIHVQNKPADVILLQTLFQKIA